MPDSFRVRNITQRITDERMLLLRIAVMVVAGWLGFHAVRPGDEVCRCRTVQGHWNASVRRPRWSARWRRVRCRQQACHGAIARVASLIGAGAGGLQPVAAVFVA